MSRLHIHKLMMSNFVYENDKSLCTQKRFPRICNIEMVLMGSDQCMPIEL